MWPDQVSNPGPLTYKSGALLTVLRGRALLIVSILDEQLYRYLLGKQLNYFPPFSEGVHS